MSITRKIGQDDVSAIGWGAMGFGGLAYGAADSDEERFQFLDKLIELGCTNWDTADIYGDSEDTIGKYFARNPATRSKIFLATKFSFTPSFTVRGDPAYVFEAVEKSLKRLGIKTIDLYYQHRVDPTVPIEKTVGAMAELVKQGKIRYIGLSEPSPASLRRAHSVHPIAAIQVEYSPFTLNIEEKGHLFDTAKELGVAIIAYSPLGRGLITGEYKSWADLQENDFRKGIPKYSEANFPKILDLVEKFKSIAKRHNATPGQVTLAWLLAQGPNVIPIPGSKKIKYVEENIGALKVKLISEDVAEIRRLCESAEVDGALYPAFIIGLTYGDSPPLDE